MVFVVALALIDHQFVDLRHLIKTLLEVFRCLVCEVGGKHAFNRDEVITEVVRLHLFRCVVLLHVVPLDFYCLLVDRLGR